jgi:hypothetical protein
MWSSCGRGGHCRRRIANIRQGTGGKLVDEYYTTLGAKVRRPFRQNRRAIAGNTLNVWLFVIASASVSIVSSGRCTGCAVAIAFTGVIIAERPGVRDQHGTVGVDRLKNWVWSSLTSLAYRVLTS